VLDPLNATGDREGSKLLADGTVKTPAGFKPAYRQFAENGWNGLTKPVEYGGQNLPQLVATPVEEMWHAANMAFDLCPLLTQGAIDAIELCGTPEQKAKFLPSMVSGAWTGTMNLTEPQAGSDLAAVRTRAVPQGDGTYKLFGQKIFITFGEHDFTDNIITSCLRARRRPLKASKAFRCSSFRSSSSTPMARSARATTCIAYRSSTSSAFTRARRPCWLTATTVAPPAT
jgi:alkylation response protein AidB-like acyl-CoA dehydrogenase